MRGGLDVDWLLSASTGSRRAFKRFAPECQQLTFPAMSSIRSELLGSGRTCIGRRIVERHLFLAGPGDGNFKA